MSREARAGLHGPVEDNAWPKQLVAHVVSSDGTRLHGYDVGRDLARHYCFAEIVLLALTGEAPSLRVGRAFEIALSLLAPIGVNEAPAHAAVLARICGATSAGVLEVSAMTLAEQAHDVVARHAPLLAWLANPSGPRPQGFAARSTQERAAVARLRALLNEHAQFHVPLLAARPAPTRDAALLATLLGCGLHRPEQLEAAWLLARLACIAAEAFATTPLSLRDYPMQLPAIRYEPARRRARSR